jgi:hypothetical protein
VFWIPLFPFTKTAVSECGNCKQVLKQSEMPSSLQPTYTTLKSQSKTPFWTFAGLGLLIVLIGTSFISSKNKDERNAQLILAPKSGDVFEIKTPDKQYTLYKVDKVEDNTVYIRMNNYEYNLPSGLRKLKEKGESAYNEELFPIEKSTLKEMLESGEILDIDRD